MPHRPYFVLLAILTFIGCGRTQPDLLISPETQRASTASAKEISELWETALANYHRAERGGEESGTAHPQLPPGDSLAVEVASSSRTYYAQKNQLQATREFRRVSDGHATCWRLRPAPRRRCLRPVCGAAGLDPSYGQSARDYQELLNHTDVSAAVRGKQQSPSGRSCHQFCKASHYCKLKAHDSAVLYLRDLVATYPRTSSRRPRDFPRGAVQQAGYKGMRRKPADTWGDSIPARFRPTRCAPGHNDRSVRGVLSSHPSRPSARGSGGPRGARPRRVGSFRRRTALKAGVTRPAQIRLAWGRIALAGEPRFKLDSIERTGADPPIPSKPSGSCWPAAGKSFALRSAPMPLAAPQWRGALITSLAQVVAFARPGIKLDLLGDQVVRVPEIDISATEIRRRSRSGSVDPILGSGPGGRGVSWPRGYI